MKKQYLVVLATIAATVIGLGSLASVQGSDVVVSIPGNTVVQDPEGDLLLRNCDPNYPALYCSLPPVAPLYLPGYFDIKTAKITQIDRGLIDLSINLYEPVPAEPLDGFVSYFWQFAGGCVTNVPGDKDSISIVWNGATKKWSANWFVITNCTDRSIEKSDDVPFKFTTDGVKVRVKLEDLLTATDETGTLIWHAGVRRVPFIYYVSTPIVQITHTTAADYAPDVVGFIPDPPFFNKPEDPATWEQR